MYKYRVEMFDKEKEFPSNYILYDTISVDGYCAEIEARRKYPKCVIAEVSRMSDYIKNYPNSENSEFGNK